MLLNNPAIFHIAVVALRAQYENKISSHNKYKHLLWDEILFSCCSYFSRKENEAPTASFYNYILAISSKQTGQMFLPLRFLTPLA